VAFAEQNYPLNTQIINGPELLFNFQDNMYYPLIIGMEKLDKSKENKLLYTYCVFKQCETGLQVCVIK